MKICSIFSISYTYYIVDGDLLIVELERYLRIKDHSLSDIEDSLITPIKNLLSD